MSRLTKSPLEALLATLDDDNALVKASTLKTVLKAVMRQVPIPGKGMKAIEMPDGIVLEAGASANLTFGFRLRVEEGAVVVNPGFWDFVGQPTFPGYGDGQPFGLGQPAPSLISYTSSQTVRFYLRANHDEWGVLSGVPFLEQSTSSLVTGGTTLTRIHLAVLPPPHDVVWQLTGGSLSTYKAFQTNDSAAIIGHANSHFSY